MAKKKRTAPSKPTAGPGGQQAASVAMPFPNGAADKGPDRAADKGVKARVSAAAARAVQALPFEVSKGDWTVILLSLMMVFAPGMGVPHEEMLQDTLKSIIVSFFALGAALIFFWRQRNRRDALRWHFLMVLPIMLCVYALGSMVWSHTYLAGVEAIRWFIFAVIMWLGINTISRERFPQIALAIHCGAVVVALWGTMQFWFNFKYFPQGPNPASTFVNRNFAAEYMAACLPFTLYTLARSRSMLGVSLMSFTLAYNLVYVFMLGTRSALLGNAFGLTSIVIGFFLFRSRLAFPTWNGGMRIMSIGLILATFLGLGLIKSGNPAVELAGLNALERGLGRAASISVSDGSFGVRLIMWKATGRMIHARPLSGVGAGAWEVDVPLYQTEGSQLETDYYVHNEILQLLAEYGLVGWIFLAILFSYLLLAAWRTLKVDSPERMNEGPLRVTVLASLLAFLISSNAGFPWRMASTGALFALSLASLAASDARLSLRGYFSAMRLNWSPAISQTAAVLSMMSLALAAYITQQAAACESEIVRSVKLALTITQSGDPNNPKWDKAKADLLRLVKEGTDINPHYRKITPMVADELAKWGDWKDATWIWESVISSRPYVVAIMSNIARGYAQQGNSEKALEYLARAKKLQPGAVSVRSLEVILYSRTGKEEEARRLAHDALTKGLYDYDLVNAAYILGVRGKDWPLALQGLALRNKDWPAQAVDGWIKVGNIYAATEAKDEKKAAEAYQAALTATPEKDKDATRKMIPTMYLSRISG